MTNQIMPIFAILKSTFPKRRTMMGTLSNCSSGLIKVSNLYNIIKVLLMLRNIKARENISHTVKYKLKLK